MLRETVVMLEPPVTRFGQSEVVDAVEPLPLEHRDRLVGVCRMEPGPLAGLVGREVARRSVDASDERVVTLGRDCHG